MEQSKNPYKDVLIISAGLLIFHLLLKQSTVAKQVFLYLAIGIPVISLLSPFIAEKMVWGWHKLGEGMGYVTSRIILTIVFFVFLTPIALLSRLSRGDTLRLKKSEGSYYTERNHQYGKKDMEKMW